MPGCSSLRVEQAQGGAPVGHAKLAQDRGDVCANGDLRDEEAAGDLRGRQSLPEQVEYLPFAAGQFDTIIRLIPVSPILNLVSFQLFSRIYSMLVSN